MKKIMVLAVIVSMLAVSASPALARGDFRGPGRGGGPLWAAVGLGLLAGAVVVDLLNRPSPPCPPPGSVVTVPAAPVVVTQPAYAEPPVSPLSDAVIVNAELLNIRSGPGYQNPVGNRGSKGCFPDRPGAIAAMAVCAGALGSGGLGDPTVHRAGGPAGQWIAATHERPPNAEALT